MLVWGLSPLDWAPSEASPSPDSSVASVWQTADSSPGPRQLGLSKLSSCGRSVIDSESRLSTLLRNHFVYNGSQCFIFFRSLHIIMFYLNQQNKNTHSLLKNMFLKLLPVNILYWGQCPQSLSDTIIYERGVGESPERGPLLIKQYWGTKNNL